MEREEAAEIRRRFLHEALLGERLGLRPRFRAGKDLRARLLRGALPAPAVAKVAVQIDAGAAAAPGAAAILAPQTVRRVRVLVAVRIGDGQHVPVDVAHVGGLRLPVLGELVDDVRDGRRTDPFARMNAAVQPDGRIARVAVGDAAQCGEVLM